MFTAGTDKETEVLQFGLWVAGRIELALTCNNIPVKILLNCVS